MKSKRHFAHSSGVALIVVLWAVGLISTALFGLVAILQRQIGQEVAALQNARAMLVAESGIQMALNSQLRPEDMDEACRQLSGKLQEGWYTGKTPVEVHFEIEAKDMSEEAAKININALLLGNKTLARSVLQNLFAGWEVNLTTSSSLIDALLDWVDLDSSSTGSNSGTETNVPNDYFKKVEELEKVVGWSQMAKEAKEGSKSVDALSKFTVYGREGKLSLRSAEQDVIEAWLELGAGAATNFIRQRPGPDQISGTADDIVTQGLPLLDANYVKWMGRVVVAEEDLWRVTSTGFVGKAKRKVVALISRKTNPPQVKARWTEEEANP
jgi:type II secretory pathway component PulK